MKAAWRGVPQVLAIAVVWTACSSQESAPTERSSSREACRVLRDALLATADEVARDGVTNMNRDRIYADDHVMNRPDISTCTPLMAVNRGCHLWNDGDRAASRDFGVHASSAACIVSHARAVAASILLFHPAVSREGVQR